MQKLLLLLLAGWVFPAKAQIVAERVNKYATQNSIDTFMVYSFPCSGGMSIDSCHVDEPHYLIWQKSGNFFLKRFDYCKTYQILSIPTNNPLLFYMNNKKSIDIEQIHQPTYYEVKKNKKTIDTLIMTSVVDHSCYHTFQLPLTKKAKFKSADVYDLDFKVFDDGKKNIYYKYNQNTKFKALIDLTINMIKQLESANKFESK